MSARSSFVVCTFVLFGLLLSSCSLGDTFAPQPTPTATRTRRPTATQVPTETDTPTATSTPLNTATFTAVPPTATDTELPATVTFTPRPPTATFTRRPPTLTFTPAPPTATFSPAGPPCPDSFPNCVIYRWIDPGHPFTSNECNFLNGTRVEGKVMRKDGSLLIGVRNTAVMHISIKGDNAGSYAYPGIYRQFPTEADGRWNADLPKRPKDFEWHIYLSAAGSDDPISADLFATSSSADNCGQPGTHNFFVADWVVP
jgi:hypothetical protein